MTWLSVQEQIEYYAYKHPRTGCWLWRGALTKDGYGVAAKVGGTGSGLAHRISFEHFRMEIPVEYEINHICRVRNCVNPEHLEIVTHRENVRKGIYPRETHKNGRKTHCMRGHLFDEGNTIKEVYLGKIRRKCRICNNEMQLRNYYKRK